MLLLNTSPARGQALPPEDAAAFREDAAERASAFLSRVPGHGRTPLLSLPALARELGLGAVHIKDEGRRFGLGSFKALGGAYAVLRLAAERSGAAEVGGLSASGSGLTFACATDGNHGRSVAWGAGLVGAAAVIFVHAGVSAERADAIARHGARVVTVPGSYDDAVAEAARVAEAEGWTLVSDTSWPGYERIPRLVMQGYTVLAREALAALPEPPTHVFIQAGVGGVAAALAGYLALALGPDRPTLVVVEPTRAACLFESARLGRPTKVPAGEPTVMAMLECHEPSLIAWTILERAADAFMTVDEVDAITAMNRLARPAPGDPAVVAGESGGAGLAGLSRAAADAEARRLLGLDSQARALLVNTEGATDPARYAALVGLQPEDVEGRAGRLPAGAPR